MYLTVMQQGKLLKNSLAVWSIFLSYPWCHSCYLTIATLDEKKVIEKKEQNELKGMEYFLTEVIITSLK